MAYRERPQPGVSVTGNSRAGATLLASTIIYIYIYIYIYKAPPLCMSSLRCQLVPARTWQHAVLVLAVESIR